MAVFLGNEAAIASARPARNGRRIAVGSADAREEHRREAVFVPLDPSVRVAPVVHDAEGDAVLALVALEVRVSDPRGLVRRARESLGSRGGGSIDAGALVHEALRLMPSPGERRSA